MTKHDDGGPAYPHKFTVRSDSGDAVVSEPGMTWLDRCAIELYKGMLANPKIIENYTKLDIGFLGGIRQTAWKEAAAMLREKRRREQQ